MTKITLTEEQVADARQMYRDGHSAASVGSSFGLNAYHARNMLLGLTYSNVPRAISRDEMRNCGGTAISYAKIDKRKVVDIKRMLNEGKSSARIASVFSIHRSAVSDIACGESWSHVGPPLKIDKKRNRSNQGRIGSNNSFAKLDEVKVSYLKWHLNIGVSCYLLAKYFKVHVATVKKIARGLTWKHVKPDKNSPPLIFSPERELPMRLQGDRLKAKWDEVRANGFTRIEEPAPTKKAKKKRPRKPSVSITTNPV